MCLPLCLCSPQRLLASKSLLVLGCSPCSCRGGSWLYNSFPSILQQVWGGGPQQPRSLCRYQGPFLPNALSLPTVFQCPIQFFGLQTSYKLGFCWLFTLFFRRSATCSSWAQGELGSTPTYLTAIFPSLPNFFLLIPRFSFSLTLTSLDYLTCIRSYSFQHPAPLLSRHHPFCYSSYLYNLFFFLFFGPSFFDSSALPLSSTFTLNTQSSHPFQLFQSCISFLSIFSF